MIQIVDSLEKSSNCDALIVVFLNQNELDKIEFLSPFQANLNEFIAANASFSTKTNFIPVKLAQFGNRLITVPVGQENG